MTRPGCSTRSMSGCSRPRRRPVLLDPSTADRHAVTADRLQRARPARWRSRYGNGTVTHLRLRPADLPPRASDDDAARVASPPMQRTVQDLAYFYDPVGNITRIRDDADTQNVIFFRNQRVEPSADYTYDPLYRLIAATGREHLGQTGGALLAAAAGHQRRLLPHPTAPARRRQRDGHLHRDLRLRRGRQHPRRWRIRSSSGGWTRHYAYAEPSQIVAGRDRQPPHRRPACPAIPPPARSRATYAHDAHGNMTGCRICRRWPGTRTTVCARPRAQAGRRRHAGPPSTPTTPPASACAR